MGGTASTFTVDVSDPAQISGAAQRVRSEVGAVDILVNNAGIVVGKEIHRIEAAAIGKVMAVNANAVMWTTNEFLPEMLARETGGSCYDLRVLSPDITEREERIAWFVNIGGFNTVGRY